MSKGGKSLKGTVPFNDEHPKGTVPLNEYTAGESFGEYPQTIQPMTKCWGREGADPQRASECL